jgi:hypothetical protein
MAKQYYVSLHGSEKNKILYTFYPIDIFQIVYIYIYLN